MKIAPLHLALCILLGCASSQEAPEAYEGGPMGPEAYMRDEGLKDGLWATWHESGQMQARGHLENGEGEGLWTYWEEDGRLGATGPWEEGLRDGRWADWHQNGVRKSEGQIRDGKREGLWTYWHENGVQQAEGPFVLDRREGAWTFWDEDRDVRAAGMYAEGQQVGDWSFAPEGSSEKKDAVRARAEALLQLLRDEQWESAADFVLVGEATRRHLGIAEGASPEVRRERVARFYEGIYGKQGPSSLPQHRSGPGSVRSVRIDPQDPDLAHVSYRHGGLDGFEMRSAEGDWYYSFE